LIIVDGRLFIERTTAVSRNPISMGFPYFQHRPAMGGHNTGKPLSYGINRNVASNDTHTDTKGRRELADELAPEAYRQAIRKALQE
jgi:hypothetical protein